MPAAALADMLLWACLTCNGHL